jgi:hypothetical protein
MLYNELVVGSNNGRQGKRETEMKGSERQREIYCTEIMQCCSVLVTPLPLFSLSPPPSPSPYLLFLPG